MMNRSSRKYKRRLNSQAFISKNQCINNLQKVSNKLSKVCKNKKVLYSTYRKENNINFWLVFIEGNIEGENNWV